MLYNQEGIDHELDNEWECTKSKLAFATEKTKSKLTNLIHGLRPSGLRINILELFQQAFAFFRNDTFSSPSHRGRGKDRHSTLIYYK